MKKKYIAPFLLLLLAVGLVAVSAPITYAEKGQGVESVEGEMEAEIEFYKVEPSKDTPSVKGEDDSKSNFLPKTGEVKGISFVLIGFLVLSLLVVIIKRKVVDFDE